MNRKIIHLDMDAFYASIEERDNPELRGKPVIVGSPPNVRGVVSTCNYEARKYGVHSAMSSAEAYRRCPHAVFVPCHFSKYEEASQKVHKIMESYTDKIEFLSLDEGYMDVTGSEMLFGPAENIALEIQQKVFEAVGTTCSVGVGYNMLSAKLASEEKKPQGFFVIESPEKFFELMKDRSVGVLYGVGKKTQERLLKMGIRTVGELANTPPALLSSFGILGEDMILYAKGIDHREVIPNSASKSIGKETTFLEDVDDIDILSDTLLLIARKISDRLKEEGLLCRTVTLKVKYPDMHSISRSHSGKLTSEAGEIYEVAHNLLIELGLHEPVRLIGISTGNLVESGYEQVSFSELTDPKPEKDSALNSVIAELRNTFGGDKLKTAKELLAERHLTDIFKDKKEDK